MDPVTLALIASSLGPALVAVFTKLAEKGVIDPALEKGLEPFRNWLTRGYDGKKDEARLTKALQAALPTDAELKLFLAFSDLKTDPALAVRAAAAVVEMTGDDPARLPPDLLRDLKLNDSHRPALATALFKLRAELVKVEGFGDGIRYANDLHKLNRLDGLYELAAGLAATVTDAEGGKVVRVQVVSSDARTLEARYLTNLMNDFAGLPLESRSKEDTLRPDDQLRLERVYIALNTTEARQPPPRPSASQTSEVLRTSEVSQTLSEKERVPLSALRATMESRRLVLLGDPGSGKSTFAQHLCLCLAGARLNPDGDWPKRLMASDVEGWELAFYPFPIFIRLRAFAHDMECLPDDPKQVGRAEHLLAFIQKEVSKLGRKELADPVLDLLENNGQAFVVLDGLDEVAQPERRKMVAEAIQHFTHKRFPQARVLVTCRVKQYPLDARGQPSAAWKLPAFPTEALADFAPEQINEFVGHWFAELYARGRAPDPDDKRNGLLAALDARPELKDLARKPILLTQMALVHTLKKLPDSRIDVYKECAQLLLWEWERLKSRQSGRGESAEDVLATLNIPGLRLSEVEDALDEAAFRAHADGDPEISGDKIRHALKKLFVELYNLPSDRAFGAAEKFILDWLNGRSGLLTPASEDTFDVPHRSFREFMAARFLREHALPNPTTGEDEDWKQSGPRLAKADPDTWREVLRFAAALASLPDVANALNELCPDQLGYDSPEVGKLLLTAEIARDVGGTALRNRSNKLGRQVYDRLERFLLYLLRDTDPASGYYPDDLPRLTPPKTLPPKTRLAAGEALDALGWTPPDLFDFVPIYNTDAQNAKRTDRDPLNSTHPSFFLARYPVTNLQYGRFLESDDYDKDTIWQNVAAFDADQKTQTRNMGDEAWNWFQQASKEGKRVPGYWDDPRFGRSRRLFPVVGVTWYEAAAYCVWLQRNLADLPEGQTLTSNFKLQTSNLALRLPTEDEWEKAAGGKWKDAKAEKETPRYAWQETPAKVRSDEIVKHANTSESDLGGTTPVCMYPTGMSLAKVMDMAGNVWEWQANLYQKGGVGRVLRGGAWYSKVEGVAASARNYNRPDFGHLNNGFRVCAAASVSRS